MRWFLGPDGNISDFGLEKVAENGTEEVNKVSVRLNLVVFETHDSQIPLY